MTRKEEIREVAARILQDVKTYDALSIKATLIGLCNKVLELTAPESSPAPLESQGELWKEIAYDFSREKEFKIATGLQDLLKSKFTLMRNDLGNNQKGRTEGDLEEKN